jgi:hypothetical protein
MELTVTSFLWTLMPEHGAKSVKFAHIRLQVQSMLNKCPNHRSGGLWPQGKELAVAIRKGVHFLFHNICTLTDTAGEKFGLFKDRYANFLEAEVGEDPSGSRLHQLPLSDNVGQDIIYAFDTGYRHGAKLLHL